MKYTQTQNNIQSMLKSMSDDNQIVDYDFDWEKADNENELVDTYELMTFYILNQEKYGNDMYDNFIEAEFKEDFILNATEVLKDFLYNVYCGMPVEEV